MPDAAGPSAASLAFAALSIVALLASGWWTNRRYRRFDRLPGHYGLTGRATRMDSRKVMAWLLPVVFSLVIAGIAGLQMAMPAEAHRGDPSILLTLMPMILLGAQGLVLWLLHRWAARQPHG